MSERRQCWRETAASARTISHSGLVPAVIGWIPSGTSNERPFGGVTATRMPGSSTVSCRMTVRVSFFFIYFDLRE